MPEHGEVRGPRIWREAYCERCRQWVHAYLTIGSDTLRLSVHPRPYADVLCTGSNDLAERRERGVANAHG